MDLRCCADIYVCENCNSEFWWSCSIHWNEYISKLKQLVEENWVSEKVRILVGECSNNCKRAQETSSATMYVNLWCVEVWSVKKHIHPGEYWFIYTWISSNKLDEFFHDILSILEWMEGSADLKKRVESWYGK